MEQELVFSSPVPPSVNHYLAYRTVIKNGKPMAMSYKTKEAKEYQKYIINLLQEEVKKQNWVKSDNKFQHSFIFQELIWMQITISSVWQMLLRTAI